MGLRMSNIGLSKEWALRWLRGSIASYMRGKISLPMLIGRVKRCIESYGVSPSEVESLAQSIILDPGLMLGGQEERQKVLEPLFNYLRELKKSP
ncbi:hypothetical protein [Infirmifilum sp.]|jgi:hypothetical protein|uniref:hypothetical protein n=1 Tax=Infirmifilum sp. TaxID=2856575 RepID=UPI003D0AA7CA